MTYTLIQTQTLASTAATITFSSLPQSYTDLLIVASARSGSASSGDTVVAQFNGDTTATNYTYRRLMGNGTASSVATGNFFFVGYCSAASDAANAFGNAQVLITNYTGAAAKVGNAESAYENNASLAIAAIHTNAWSGTAAITSVALTAPSATAFQVGSTFSIYGIK